jgi:hypothetical protein
MAVPLPALGTLTEAIPMNPNDSATVVFHRPAGIWRDLLRSYRLYLDGQVCGKIRRGREVPVVVSPGYHVAQVRIDWTGSPEVAFEIDAGQTVWLRVDPAGNALQGWQMFGATTYLKLSLEPQHSETSR